MTAAAEVTGAVAGTAAVAVTGSVEDNALGASNSDVQEGWRTFRTIAGARPAHSHRQRHTGRAGLGHAHPPVRLPPEHCARFARRVAGGGLACPALQAKYLDDIGGMVVGASYAKWARFEDLFAQFPLLM